MSKSELCRKTLISQYKWAGSYYTNRGDKNPSLTALQFLAGMHETTVEEIKEVLFN